MSSTADAAPTANPASTAEAATTPAAATTAATAPLHAVPLSPGRGFLDELVHAMQLTAERQRDATDAEVEAMTTAHLERVRARTIREADELRRMAQDDIDAVHAWRESEASRLRDEAEERIVARGHELDDYLMRHASMVDSEIDQIEGAVDAYRGRLHEYFDRLTKETDPVEIARLADEVPEPPDLGKVGGEARAQTVAAIVAEDGGPFDPAEPGPDLVPVMADASTSANDQPSTNPALRLLRSIATLATASESKAATAQREDATAEPSVDGAASTAGTDRDVRVGDDADADEEPVAEGARD